MSEEFNFPDFDFLELTPPKARQNHAQEQHLLSTSAQDPQELAKCRRASNKQNKCRKLAERIAEADELITHTRQLEQQLHELKESAQEIRQLYETEKAQRVQFETKMSELDDRCAKLDEELVNVRLQRDQLEGQLAEFNGGLEYRKLALQYIRLAQKLDEDRMLHWQDRATLKLMIEYCQDQDIAVPQIRSPRKRKTKAEKGTQCALLVEPTAEPATLQLPSIIISAPEVPVPKTTHDQSTQCGSAAETHVPQTTYDQSIQCGSAAETPVPKTTHDQSTQCVSAVATTCSQGTQHISSTTTRSTSTACFIKQHHMGTMFPERSTSTAHSAAFDDIMRELKRWDSIVPVSPIVDVTALPPPSLPPPAVIYHSVGTCTFLCNVQRQIDFLPNTTANIKHEINPRTRSPSPFNSPLPAASPPSPTQSSAPRFGNNSNFTFEELWGVFGQILYGLLHHRNPPAAVHTPLPGANQPELNSWMRSIYDNMQTQQQNTEQAVADEQMPRKGFRGGKAKRHDKRERNNSAERQRKEAALHSVDAASDSKHAVSEPDEELVANSEALTDRSCNMPLLLPSDAEFRVHLRSRRISADTQRASDDAGNSETHKDSQPSTEHSYCLARQRALPKMLNSSRKRKQASKGKRKKSQTAGEQVLIADGCVTGLAALGADAKSPTGADANVPAITTEIVNDLPTATTETAEIWQQSDNVAVTPNNDALNESNRSAMSTLEMELELSASEDENVVEEVVITTPAEQSIMPTETIESKAGLTQMAEALTASQETAAEESMERNSIDDDDTNYSSLLVIDENFDNNDDDEANNNKQHKEDETASAEDKNVVQIEVPLTAITTEQLVTAQAKPEPPAARTPNRRYDEVAVVSVFPLQRPYVATALRSAVEVAEQQPPPPKYSRKRKSDTIAVTPLLPCKRSERLRVKQQTALSTTAPSPLGKYTKRSHGALNAERQRTASENEAEALQPPESERAAVSPTAMATSNKADNLSLAVNMPYFRQFDLNARAKPATPKRPNLKTPMAETTTTTILKANCDSTRRESASAENSDAFSAEDDFDCVPQERRQASTEVRNSLELPLPPSPFTSLRPTQTESDCDGDVYDSPASPPPNNAAADDSPPPVIAIPLECQLGSGALLDRLIDNHRDAAASLTKSAMLTKQRQRALQLQLNAALGAYLTSDAVDGTAEEETTAAARQLAAELQSISSEREPIVCAIVEAVRLHVPLPETELACAPLDVPPAYESIRLRRMGKLLSQLLCCREALIARLECVLFSCDTADKLSLADALNLTQLYLHAVTASTAAGGPVEPNPARLYIAKCLYYHQLMATPMIYQVLCRFPTVLPHREERSYDRADALITVIQHALMCTVYDMNKPDMRMRELLSMLRFEYHYEPFKPDQAEVLQNLIDKLRAGKLANVVYALAIYCKRLPPHRVVANVLQPHLLPLANEYYALLLQTDAYDERVAALLGCISTVVKPFPLQTDIASYLALFGRYLNAVPRIGVQEAAVQAILRLQRFGYVDCYRALQHFRLGAGVQLQLCTRAMLQTFVLRKSAQFWHTVRQQQHRMSATSI